MKKQIIIHKETITGLKVIFLKDSRYTTSAVLFGFKVGWRNDPSGQEGLAHLFEHLVGKRTKKFEEKSSFDREKELLGIKYSAVTYPDYTYYLHHQSYENLEKSIALMFESIYNSYFNKEDLENEKKVVLSEAGEYIDDDSKYLFFKSRESLFKGTSISKFFFGTKNTLKKITIEVFEDFYKYCKDPQNAYLIIAGPDEMSEDLLIDKINIISNSYNVESGKQILPIKDSLSKISKGYSSNRKRKQALVLQSFRGTNFNIEQKVLFDFFKAILVDGFNSKLISRLRDRLGLIYWAYINLVEVKPYVEISVETSTDKKNLRKILPEIRNIINELKVVTQDEINERKELVKFNVLSGINAVDDAVFSLTSLIEYGSLVTTEEYLEMVIKVKAIDLSNFVLALEKENCVSVLN